MPCPLNERMRAFMQSERVICTGEADVFCLCAASEPLGSTFSGHSSRVKLWSPDGELVHSLDTPTPGDVTCFDTCLGRFAISVDKSVYCYDQRNLSAPLQTYTFNRDDINQLSFNKKGEFLAACDDSGDIQVIAVEDNRIFKTCRRNGHVNICSAVAFHPKRTWELVSGGLDCYLIRWDFSRGKPSHTLNMQEVVTGSNSDTAYLVNPPMVHSLSCWQHDTYLACGLGNGTVTVCDIASKKEMSVLCSARLHSASIGSIQCLPRRQDSDDKDSFIVSGGNDSKLVLSKLVRKEPTGAALSSTSTVELVECSAMQHGYKINWITQVPNSDAGHKFIIADQTSKITTYSIQ